MGDVLALDHQRDRLAFFQGNFVGGEREALRGNRNRLRRLVSCGEGRQGEATEKYRFQNKFKIHANVSSVQSICIQGARYLRISCSSSALNMARTRICCTTALTSRGDNESGGLWQRPQFSLNFCSPGSDAVFLFAVLLFAVVLGPFGVCVAVCGVANIFRECPNSKIKRRVRNSTLIGVLQAMREIGIDRQFQNSRYWRCPQS